VALAPGARPIASARAERDLMEDRNVGPDLRRLADDRAQAVIDEDARADARAGMDVDAGEEPRRRLHETRQHGQPGLAQEVRDPVGKHRPEARVAQGLEESDRPAAEGGISREHGAEVAARVAEIGEGAGGLGEARPQRGGDRRRGQSRSAPVARAALHRSVQRAQSEPSSAKPIRSRRWRSTRLFSPSAG